MRPRAPGAGARSGPEPLAALLELLPAAAGAGVVAAGLLGAVHERSGLLARGAAREVAGGDAAAEGGGVLEQRARELEGVQHDRVLAEEREVGLERVLDAVGERVGLAEVRR